MFQIISLISEDKEKAIQLSMTVQGLNISMQQNNLYFKLKAFLYCTVYY